MDKINNGIANNSQKDCFLSSLLFVFNYAATKYPGEKTFIS